MLKGFFAIIIASFALAAAAAQIEFDFTKYTNGTCPSGFLSAVTATGSPAHWKIEQIPVPPILAPFSPDAPQPLTERSVLSVQSFDLGENHFPVLLYTNEIFTDFTLTTRFKISGGIVEPAAGVIYRAQNESNYYAVRASTQGYLLWFKVVNGKSYEAAGGGVGIKTPIAKDAWRELKIECSGDQTRCYLDGKLAIPPAQPGAPTNGLAINDPTFSQGKIGFWAKADTKCYFVDARIDYSTRVPYLQVVIDSVLRKNPQVVGLEVYARKKSELPVIIGGMDQKQFGAIGTKTEADVIERGSIYYLKDHKWVEITLPLRDRNGDVAAAIKVRLKTFKGETQNTAISRAALIKKAIEQQIETMENING